MLHSKLLNKDNIDVIFDAFSKEMLNYSAGETNVYVVGGGAIVLSFDYRMSTLDIDAIFNNKELVEKAIAETASKLNLPSDWLNSDFIKTPSYSPKIEQFAKLYKTYNGVVNIYVLDPKYLIAMKLKSSRPTGGDLDDIIKMIYELRHKRELITYEDVISAYEELYSDFSNTYEYFIRKTKEAFDKPIEDIDEYYELGL